MTATALASPAGTAHDTATSADAILTENLIVRRSDFTLGPITMAVPAGTVVGLIGTNGAGKTTLIKTLLGLIFTAEGTATLFDTSTRELNVEQFDRIGIVSQTPNFPQSMTVQQCARIMQDLHARWDPTRFTELCEQFHLPLKKKLEDFSIGMAKQFMIAGALSHQADLLVLDEPTAGLDPLAREKVINLLREFMLDDSHSILFSTHITSDLEHFADYLCLLHNGQLILESELDTVLETYRLLHCTRKQFQSIDQNDILAFREERFSITVLTARANHYPTIPADPATITDIMGMLIDE